MLSSHTDGRVAPRSRQAANKGPVLLLSGLGFEALTSDVGPVCSRKHISHEEGGESKCRERFPKRIQVKHLQLLLSQITEIHLSRTTCPHKNRAPAARGI